MVKIDKLDNQNKDNYKNICWALMKCSIYFLYFKK